MQLCDYPDLFAAATARHVPSCEKDTSYLLDAAPSLVQAYAKQVLSSESDLLEKTEKVE